MDVLPLIQVISSIWVVQDSVYIRVLQVGNPHSSKPHTQWPCEGAKMSYKIWKNGQTRDRNVECFGTLESGQKYVNIDLKFMYFDLILVSIALIDWCPSGGKNAN